MAQKTSLSLLALPGGTHVFIAKTAGSTWHKIALEGYDADFENLTASTIQADNGFTGTGAYTNFTIVGGVITAAS